MDSIPIWHVTVKIDFTATECSFFSNMSSGFSSQLWNEFARAGPDGGFLLVRCSRTNRAGGGRGLSIICAASCGQPPPHAIQHAESKQGVYLVPQCIAAGKGRWPPRLQGETHGCWAWACSFAFRNKRHYRIYIYIYIINSYPILVGMCPLVFGMPPNPCGV